MLPCRCAASVTATDLSMTLVDFCSDNYTLERLLGECRTSIFEVAFFMSEQRCIILVGMVGLEIRFVVVTIDTWMTLLS